MKGTERSEGSAVESTRKRTLTKQRETDVDPYSLGLILGRMKSGEELSSKHRFIHSLSAECPSLRKVARCRTTASASAKKATVAALCASGRLEDVKQREDWCECDAQRAFYEPLADGSEDSGSEHVADSDLAEHSAEDCSLSPASLLLPNGGVRQRHLAERRRKRQISSESLALCTKYLSICTLIPGIVATERTLPQLKELHAFMESAAFASLSSAQQLQRDDIQHARCVLYRCGVLKARNSNRVNRDRFASIRKVQRFLKARIRELQRQNEDTVSEGNTSDE